MIRYMLLVLSIGTLDCTAWADQIWLAPPRLTEAESDWYPRAVKVIDGKIEQFDARQLLVVVRGDEVSSTFAAYRVLWIEPEKRSEKETAALKLFTDGQYAQSLRPFIDSLADRPPVWRQQWISMQAAKAAWLGAQPKIALELVSQLDQNPLPGLVVATLPIDWNGKVKSATQAQTCLLYTSPSPRDATLSRMPSSA